MVLGSGKTSVNRSTPGEGWGTWTMLCSRPVGCAGWTKLSGVEGRLGSVTGLTVRVSGTEGVGLPHMTRKTEACTASEGAPDSCCLMTALSAALGGSVKMESGISTSSSQRQAQISASGIQGAPVQKDISQSKLGMSLVAISRANSSASCWFVIVEGALKMRPPKRGE